MAEWESPLEARWKPVGDILRNEKDIVEVSQGGHAQICSVEGGSRLVVEADYVER